MNLDLILQSKSKLTVPIKIPVCDDLLESLLACKS